MSFIKGKQNLYSIISNSIIKHVKNKQNDFLLSKLKSFPDSGTKYKGMPTNLIVISSLNVNCGESDECYKCMKIFGVTDDNLTGDNYLKNKESIDKIRNNQCLGSCTCNIENISLSDTLIFDIGYTINGTDDDNNSIVADITNEMTTYSTDDSSSTSRNWLPLLLGLLPVPGSAVFGAAFVLAGGSDTVTNKIKDDMTRVVTNINLVFNQTINQLLTSIQIVEIQGTGIQVKNVSLSTIQNAILTATLSASCTDGSCIDNDLTNITNTLITSLLEGISTTFNSSLQYAYDQNKTLIIGTIIFLVTIICLYIFLIIKKAIHKVK